MLMFIKFTHTVCNVDLGQINFTIASMAVIKEVLSHPLYIAQMYNVLTNKHLKVLKTVLDPRNLRGKNNIQFLFF